MWFWSANYLVPNSLQIRLCCQIGRKKGGKNNRRCDPFMFVCMYFSFQVDGVSLNGHRKFGSVQPKEAYNPFSQEIVSFCDENAEQRKKLFSSRRVPYCIKKVEKGTNKKETTIFPNLTGSFLLRRWGYKTFLRSIRWSYVFKLIGSCSPKSDHLRSSRKKQVRTIFFFPLPSCTSTFFIDYQVIVQSPFFRPVTIKVTRFLWKNCWLTGLHFLCEKKSRAKPFRKKENVVLRQEKKNCGKK